MGDTSPHVAQEPFGLNLAGFLVVPAPVYPSRSDAIPCLESIGIVLSHLLLSGETFTELVEHQISVDRRDTAHQDHQHPLHLCYLMWIRHSARLFGGKQTG
ncbi:hypothetical protein SE91_04400 [Bradyrhizobium sp. DOA1]|nr:hypothetical protein SE91_04400 [Bradyrhizobium sp. DOA1]